MSCCNELASRGSNRDNGIHSARAKCSRPRFRVNRSCRASCGVPFDPPIRLSDVVHDLAANLVTREALRAPRLDRALGDSVVVGQALLTEESSRRRLLAQIGPEAVKKALVEILESMRTAGHRYRVLALTDTTTGVKVLQKAIFHRESNRFRIPYARQALATNRGQFAFSTARPESSACPSDARCKTACEADPGRVRTPRC
jgi:hypothetical protein